MKNVLLTFLIATTLFVGLSSRCAVAQDSNGSDDVSSVVEATLDIDPVEQKTLAWCWLSVGEMIFTYLDLDEPRSGYQCGTIAMIGGPLSACWANCAACPVPSGTMQRLENMIRDYPKAIALYQGEVPPSSLLLSSRYGVLSWDELKKQILKKSPVVTAINPLDPSKPVPQHVALIVGFKETGDKRLLLINDPAPYSILGIDPYGDNGGEEEQSFQYWIEYSKFKTGLAWNYSAYGISDPSKHKNPDDLGITIRHRKVVAAANDSVPSPPPIVATQPLPDHITYMSLSNAVPKWADDLRNGFPDQRLIRFAGKAGEFSSVGLSYDDEQKSLEIDPGTHYASIVLERNTDFSSIKSKYSDICSQITSALPGWTAVEDTHIRDNGLGGRTISSTTYSNGTSKIEATLTNDSHTAFHVDLNLIW